MDRESRKFDIRTLPRFVRDGIVDRDKYEEHLEALPDVADKAAPMEAEFEAGVLDDDDAEAEEEGDEEATEEEESD